MLDHIVHAVARPFVRSWRKSSVNSWRSLPLPLDLPIAHAPGANADRVLLIGNGIAVGYGVFSHDLALAGHLARRLSSLTGRGTTVDVRAAPDMTTREAVQVIRGERMQRYDAIVSTLGGLEAAEFGSVATWRADLETFIEAIRAVAPTARVHFVGVPNPSSLVPLPRIYRRLAEAHALRFNEATREVCLRYPNCSFVPFDPIPSDDYDEITPRSYRRWADMIAWPVADSLDQQLGLEWTSNNEEDRMAALRRLAILDTSPDEELEKIVATVRDLFGASGAGLNIIDTARHWVMAAAGMSLDDKPRRESVCTRTIASADLLIVEDTQLDPTYGTKPWAHGDEAVRFYAGYPIESPDGQRLGALCIVDSKPRKFSETDQALFRELAMLVQGRIWQTAAD